MGQEIHVCGWCGKRLLRPGPCAGIADIEVCLEGFRGEFWFCGGSMERCAFMWEMVEG